jgi:hypothetical protein
VLGVAGSTEEEMVDKDTDDTDDTAIEDCSGITKSVPDITKGTGDHESEILGLRGSIGLTG